MNNDSVKFEQSKKYQGHYQYNHKDEHPLDKNNLFDHMKKQKSTANESNMKYKDTENSSAFQTFMQVQKTKGHE